VSEHYAEDLAAIHDAGFGELARAAAGFLRRELEERGIERGLVLDLGCGSGILAAELSSAGYDVLGLDQSEAFLALARARAPRARFELGSLFAFEPPPCCAVTAVGECFNYLFDERNDGAALEALFRRVHAALQPGGPFVFDVAEPGRVGRAPTQGFVEGPGWTVLVAREEDPATRVLTRRITAFRRLGEHYRRSHEVHRQRLYPRSEVRALLEGAGFHVRELPGYGELPFANGHAGFLATR
jgi:SAM-dependent methyltransferase